MGVDHIHSLTRDRVGGSRRGRARARGHALLLALLLVATSACRTTSTLLPGSDVPAVAARAPTLPGIARVIRGEDGTALRGLHPVEVVDAFAEALAESRAFREVVYRGSDEGQPADVLLTVSVDVQADPHRWKNLAKDAVVGLSVMALQPLLPHEADLTVQVRVGARRAGNPDGPVVSVTEAATSRLSTTHLEPSAKDLADWRRQVVDAAVDRAVARLVRDPALRALAP